MNHMNETFGVDEIHELRVQIAEEYRAMPEGEAERVFNEHVSNAKRMIEQIRKEKKQQQAA